MGRGWLVVLAFAGLLIGHFMAYAVVVPDEGVRAAVLEATGHRGHDVFAPIGGAAVLAAVIGLIVHQLRGPDGGAPSAYSALRLGCTLWALQTSAFVALEVSERILSSHAAMELLHEPAFLVGLFVQAIVSLAGTFLVLLLTATITALCRYLATPASRSSALPSSLQTCVRPRSVARSAWNLRGPPVSPTS